MIKLLHLTLLLFNGTVKSRSLSSDEIGIMSGVILHERHRSNRAFHLFQNKPLSRPLSTARVRSRTPSFARMLDTWFLMVPSLIASAIAISRLL